MVGTIKGKSPIPGMETALDRVQCGEGGPYMETSIYGRSPDPF